MKIFFVVLVMCGFNMYLSAQNDFIPSPQCPLFKTYLLENATGFQLKNNSSRSVVYKEVSYSSDKYITASSTWQHLDSGEFHYSAQAVLNDYRIFSYSNTSWNFAYNYIYAYDANGNQTLNLQQRWNTYVSNWMNYESFNDTYDASHHKTSSTYQRWDSASGSWLNKSYSVYTYDTSGNLVTSILQNWDTLASAYVNSYRYLMVYDNLNRKLSQTNQKWTTGVWEDVNKHEYTYTTLSSPVLDVLTVWVGTMWLNSKKDSYVFDTLDNNIRTDHYDWNATTHAWDYNKVTYSSYNSSHRAVSVQTYVWNDGTFTWDHQSKWLYGYDAYDYSTSFEYLYWSTADNAWKPQARYTYTNDANHNRVFELDEMYNTGLSVYENYGRDYFYYQEFNPAEVLNLANEVELRIYPNPASGGYVDIYFTGSGDGFVSLSFYDACGRIMLNSGLGSGIGMQKIRTDISWLPAGMYWCRVYESVSGKQGVLKFSKP